MGISYCGVPLLLDDPDGAVQTYLDRMLPLDDFRLIGGRPDYHRNNPGKLPLPNYTWPASVKLNTFYNPSGAARWGFFVGIVNQQMRDDILASMQGALLTHKGTFEISDDRDYGQTLRRTLYALPMRPVSVPMTTRGGLFLLPLVDERWHWQHRDVGRIRCGYNATWASLLTQLSELIDALDTDDVAATEDNNAINSVNWFYPDRAHLELPFQPLGIYTDAVLHSIGRRLTDDAGTETGVLSAWRGCSWPKAIANLATNLSERLPAEDMAGGSFFQTWVQVPGDGGSGRYWLGSPLGGEIPETLRVTYNDVGGQFNELELAASTFISDARDRGLSTAEATLRLQAIGTPYGTVPSGTFYDGPITSIATAFFNSFRKRYDYLYAGLKPWRMTAFDDWLVFSLGSRTCGEYDFFTRVVSMQSDWHPAEQLSNTPYVQIDRQMRGIVGDNSGLIGLNGYGTVKLLAEDQTIQILNGIGNAAGTFTITYEDQTTGAIAFNASAATIDAALEALSNIGAGNVVCTGGTLETSEVQVDFSGGSLATYDNPRLLITDMSGCYVSVRCKMNRPVLATDTYVLAENPFCAIVNGKDVHVLKIGQRYELTAGEG